MIFSLVFYLEFKMKLAELCLTLLCIISLSSWKIEAKLTAMDRIVAANTKNPGKFEILIH